MNILKDKEIDQDTKCRMSGQQRHFMHSSITGTYVQDRPIQVTPAPWILTRRALQAGHDWKEREDKAAFGPAFPQRRERAGDDQEKNVE